MSDSASQGRSGGPRSIAANTAMNGVAMFASLFSTLIFFPLLVRAFGLADYGVFVISASVAAFALLFDFGIGVSTVNLVAKRVSLEDSAGFAVVVSTAATLMSLLGVVVALAVAAIGSASGEIFSVTPQQAELLRTLLWISAAVQLWYWPTSVAASVLSGLRRYDLVAITSVVSTVAGVVAIGIVLALRGGPVMLLILSAFIAVGTALLNIGFLVRVRPVGRMVVAPDREVAREILTGGVPVFVAGIAQLASKEQADRLVLGVVLGPAAVALYEVAAKLSMLVAQVTGLATSAVLPVASSMAARADDRGLQELFVRGGRYVTLLVAPVVVALLVLAGPFITVWFGPGFEASVRVAQLLILAQLFVPLYQIGDPILIGKGAFHLWVRRGLLLACLNLGLSVLFVAVFNMGIVGVALGTLISCLVELPLYAQVILRETQVSVRTWLATSGVGYLLLPVVAVIAFAAVSFPMLSRGILGVGVAAALAVGVYWVVAYAVVLTPAEREALWKRLGRRSAASSAGGA